MRSGVKTILFSMCLIVLAKREVRADATSDAVYQDVKQVVEDLMTQEVDQTVASHLACFSGRTPAQETDLGAVSIPDEDGRSSKYFVTEAVKYFPRTLQSIYDNRIASFRQVVTSEVAAFVGHLAYESLKKQVDDGQTKRTLARIAVLNRKTKTPVNAKATSDIEFGLLNEAQIEACGTNLGNLLAAKRIGGGASALDVDCVQPPKGDEYACDIAYAVQESLLGQQSAAESYLLSALAQYIAEIAVGTPTSAQVSAILPILAASLNADGQTNTAVTSAISQLQDALAKPSLTGVLHAPLTLLVDQWKSLHLRANGAPSITSWATGVAYVIGTACKGPDKSAGACTFFPAAAQKVGITSDLWPILQLAASGDYIDAAQLAISELFVGLQKTCDGKSGSDSCDLLRVLQQFADAMVVYTFEAQANGTPSDDARGALRTATETLVQNLAANGGIDRNSFGARSIFFPDFALRYQWSPSYVNTTAGTTRATASVTFLKLRIPLFYREMGYSALNLSLGDLIGPLAELAGRSTSATFANSERVWANLFAPRLDIEGGIPALSKHLLLGGGLSYRMVAPYQTAAATTSTPASYQYGLCSEHMFWANCFEFGVFVKYIM